MKKILYRKFLLDCLLFFLISIISTGVIIWVFQAVNYLDIVIEDGRTYVIYLYYSLLNFPKIISKILPFAFFFSFSYVIAKYELNNELLIYWNFGVNKISFINFFFIFSVIIFFIQIVLTSFVVPYSQSTARSLIRTSDYDFVSNFIKTKKFNSTINNLTIFTESKDIKGNFRNIEIDESILIPSEKQVIEDLLLAAIKDCKVKSEEASKKEMAKMGQAFGLPEGFKLPF